MSDAHARFASSRAAIACGSKFLAAGTQIAAGVPFMIDEPEGTTTFRIGLFGLDKLREPSVTTANLKRAMDVAVQATMPGY